VSDLPFNSISFAGCGALNFYQVGVAQALSEQQSFLDVDLLGASAGAALAVLLSDGYAPYAIVRRMLQLTKDVVGDRRLLGSTGVQAISRAFTDEFLDDDSHIKADGRVHISITRLRPLGNIRISTFSSRDDLADAIRAASHIPSLNRPAYKFREHWCIDGGATDNEPIANAQTLRIAPMWTSVRAHIRPSPLHVSLHEIVRLPTPRRAWELFDQGLRDGRQYLTQQQGFTLSEATAQ
jgi:predicted acylesterase/phospholipase RssA